MPDIDVLVDDYLAVWNEPDGAQRTKLIESLWTEDARHCTATIEALGYRGIEDRVSTAHEKWVVGAGNRFELSQAQHHHDTVMVRWRMVSRDDADGAVLAAGCDVLHLARDGRIRDGYQFSEVVPGA
jgi:hypothetical protein